MHENYRSPPCNFLSLDHNYLKLFTVKLAYMGLFWNIQISLPAQSIGKTAHKTKQPEWEAYFNWHLKASKV